MFSFRYADYYIRHLQDEVQYWRRQFEHERQRAEMATDELLRVRVGVGGITQATPAERIEQESVIERLLKDTEFAQAGE